jgi:ABC-type lipoprotein release transport system permease subunit
LLFGLSAASTRGMVEAMSLLAASGLVAAALPAWRAARVRLDEALRCE